MLKDWISLVSVHVSVQARQTWAILIYLLDNMDLTYVWSSSGYTPHHTGIFRAYLKVMLAMPIDLPTFSLFGPALWPETRQSLALSTRFRSEVWILFKTDFQSEYQSKGKHTQEHMHTKNEKVSLNPATTICQVSHRSVCTFFGCIILSTLTNHRSESPSASRPESGIDIVHREFSKSLKAVCYLNWL